MRMVSAMAITLREGLGVTSVKVRRTWKVIEGYTRVSLVSLIANRSSLMLLPI